jgi:hypothetical protein
MSTRLAQAAAGFHPAHNPSETGHCELSLRPKPECDKKLSLDSFPVIDCR